MYRTQTEVNIDIANQVAGADKGGCYVDEPSTREDSSDVSDEPGLGRDGQSVTPS